MKQDYCFSQPELLTADPAASFRCCGKFDQTIPRLFNPICFLTKKNSALPPGFLEGTRERLGSGKNATFNVECERFQLVIQSLHHQGPSQSLPQQSRHHHPLRPMGPYWICRESDRHRVEQDQARQQVLFSHPLMLQQIFLPHHIHNSTCCSNSCCHSRPSFPITTSKPSTHTTCCCS